ncbi:MAG TPA: glycosyltransferase family 4 protein [Gemmatimonadaceae bacterium]|nr:glycosyltransferase family 4 protein [Gemmatimonadaceae bacterium]
MTIRVLHVDTERGWRGGERQALWLAQELSRQGHDCLVAARPNEPLLERARHAGIGTVSSSPRSEADILAPFRLRRLISRRRIAVVHAHTAHAVALSALATLGTTAKLVVARRVDFRLRDNAGTRWKYGRADAIIAISHAVERVLIASGIDATRVSVVPDGVDIHRRVTPATRDLLQTLGIRRDAPLVVQVAQLVGHKDPLNFVRAMARVRATVSEAQGLLVGDGPLRGEVESEIRRLGLDDVVRLAGYRTDADAILAAADVACLSSREEGMGSVLLDALAFGRPVAATSAGGIPEVIVDGESGVIAPPGDPTALGDRIVRLLTDRALAERLGAAARLRAPEFSVERMTERTIAIYERVLATV